jgi:hypothetical protein
LHKIGAFGDEIAQIQCANKRTSRNEAVYFLSDFLSPGLELLDDLSRPHPIRNAP